jgi:hypothetical protein
MALQIHEAGLDTSLASWIFLFSLIESLKMFAQLPTCWQWTPTQGRLVCHPCKTRGMDRDPPVRRGRAFQTDAEVEHYVSKNLQLLIDLLMLGHCRCPCGQIRNE